MNAGLQCITHCEALSTYFLSKKHKRDNINQSNELVEQYDDLIEKIASDDEGRMHRDDCPLCKAGNKTQEKLFIQLYDEDDGKIKVWERGKNFVGSCRNASEAIWNGKTFTYKRYKFGSTFFEDINHFEDDDEYDLFVPIKLKD